MTGMLIWLNGTIGAGKTSTAAELITRIPGSYEFDAERVGLLLRPMLSDIEPVTDFQHWRPWRSLVAETAIELLEFSDRIPVAVQTVLHEQYWTEISGRIRDRGGEIFHVVLEADEATMRRRIEKSDLAIDWRLEHLLEFQQARSWMAAAADLIVDTTELTPAQAADHIVAALPQSAPLIG
jgi:hypothetical protein